MEAYILHKEMNTDGRNMIQSIHPSILLSPLDFLDSPPLRSVPWPGALNRDPPNRAVHFLLPRLPNIGKAWVSIHPNIQPSSQLSTSPIPSPQKPTRPIPFTIRPSIQTDRRLSLHQEVGIEKKEKRKARSTTFTLHGYTIVGCLLYPPSPTTPLPGPANLLRSSSRWATSRSSWISVQHEQQ